MPESNTMYEIIAAQDQHAGQSYDSYIERWQQAKTKP